MGMTIDESYKWPEYHKQGEVGKGAECIDTAIDTMRKYQMMQADHIADMRDMLTEIQEEAEKEAVRWYVGRVDGKSDDVVLIDTLREIIQQKIDKLKGKSE